MSVIYDVQMNRACALDHYNIIFLLEYSSYSDVNNNKTLFYLLLLN